jgi:4-amino-4-deoxy-L-arabinose transferase-like glycosyltransferase
MTLTLPTVTTQPAGPPATRPADPSWVRPALLLLLAGTGALYLWGLSASGWANAFYSAAVQAGATSWKAFFFGSSDASNFITVDKTPASLWVMALSARVFGVNSWSILVPQALEGVAAVGLLYATVRRWFGPAAGLLAGAVLALTPVAVLMFRFNNPDALLTLLLVAAAYAMTRALENASTKWVVFAGAFVGFGFLTKMLQALLLVPALGLVYLVAAPTSVRRRLVQVLAGLAALVVSAGWWIAVVELTPARYRPYIGGSQHNSILELTLGYNGLGRLSGSETGSVGGGGAGAGTGTGMWGQTGLTRLFSAEIGGQISWLLPAALILLGAGLWLTRRAPRTDRIRAAFLLWGGWLLITGVTFSFMRGIFHAYYTVALAPAIGALVGMGAVMLWRRRSQPAANILLAATMAVTAGWSFTLLDRGSGWHPWLRVAVLAGGLAVTVGLLVAGALPARFGRVVALLGIVAALAGPAGYALSTAASAHTGAIPSAGPTVAGAGFGGGRGGPGGGPGGGGFGGGAPGGGFPGGTQNGTTQNGGTQNGTTQNGTTQNGGFQGGPGGGMGGGGMGGLLGATTPSSEVVTALRQNSGAYTWAAAAVGSNNAAGYQLAAGVPVMAIGGFNGSDPAPTLAQFQAYVAAKKIHYFIGGALMQSSSGSSYGQQIASWVASHYQATTVGGTTVYDLTQPATGS